MTIIQDPDIRHGKPTVKGTRITVEDIVDRFHDLGRDPTQIAEDLGIDENDVHDALRYHEQHSELTEETVSRIKKGREQIREGQATTFEDSE